MNDDELKKLWQQQPLRTPDVSPEKLVAAMQKQTSQFRGILNARDLREWAACAFVVILFGFFYFTICRTPASRAGALIVIGSSIFIAWKLAYTRRKTPPAPPGATIIESLQAELKAVRAQSRLLGSVAWWYLFPLGVGILVCTWGNAHGGWPDVIGNIVYTLFVIILYVFIYWLNQRARAKQLLPLEAQLESLVRLAETGEPPDETRVAGLRPIVLSMAAAEHAKPVEFKVAFSQLAIYGVSGIVGIWFFWVLAVTLSHVDWKANAEAENPPVPIVRSEETNRYFTVAQKVVRLLNTGDYAAVQKLYAPEMARLFPLKETTDFYTRIATSYGPIEKIEGLSDGGYQGWPAFRLHYQRGEMTMSLALAADDSISGIYFKPVSAHHATIKTFASFVQELFSWQHLLWGMLSFLAGLVYCWLLQKATVRAVGISTLGIHLHKGLNLILWDEIKEVRTFRILNIRSLWLIKTSGEKTIMPWTGLERQSDLKAVVEKFAPANHPIRNHLSLLRTNTKHG